jgi:hypothetical protein
MNRRLRLTVLGAGRITTCPHRIASTGSGGFVKVDLGNELGQAA